LLSKFVQSGPQSRPGESQAGIFFGAQELARRRGETKKTRAAKADRADLGKAKVKRITERSEGYD